MNSNISHRGTPVLHLAIGSKYRFTLLSGRIIVVIVYGQLAGSTTWDISIDGTRGAHNDLNQALGEPWTQVASIP